ncbi:MAG: CAP domain-containing protein [Bradymonadia bacterium]
MHLTTNRPTLTLVRSFPLLITTALSVCLMSSQAAAERPATSPGDSAHPPDRQVPDARMNFDDLDLPRLSAAICEITNTTRTRHGLEALPTEKRLARAAQGHAGRMARLKFFGHTDRYSTKRKGPTERARLAGISNPYIAENVAVRTGLDLPNGSAVYVIDRERGHFATRPGGKPIPPHSYRSFAKAIVEQWMKSPGHRENILSDQGKQMGCGVALRFEEGMPRLYGVQVFQWFQPVKAAD